MDRLESFTQHQVTQKVLRWCQYALGFMYLGPVAVKAFDIVPRPLLALECSLFPTLFSIVFINFLHNLSKNESNLYLEWLKNILRHRYWRIMRPIMKVCYLINPVIIVYMIDHMPLKANQMDYIAAYMQFHKITLLFIWYNYAASVLLTLLFDMPLLNMTNAWTRYLFENNEKSKKQN